MTGERVIQLLLVVPISIQFNYGNIMKITSQLEVL